jgi:hypothetical protein
MFTDPQKVKFDGSTETEVPRVSTGDYTSTYLSADGLSKMTISTALTKSKRKRHTLRLDLSKLTTDPYDTSQNVEVSTSAYVVVDRPIAGFTNTELKKLVEGLVGFLSASSYSATTKLIASES